jgi:hypothetical protein
LCIVGATAASLRGGGFDFRLATEIFYEIINLTGNGVQRLKPHQTLAKHRQQSCCSAARSSDRSVQPPPSAICFSVGTLGPTTPSPSRLWLSVAYHSNGDTLLQRCVAHASPANPSPAFPSAGCDLVVKFMVLRCSVAWPVLGGIFTDNWRTNATPNRFSMALALGCGVRQLFFPLRHHHHHTRPRNVNSAPTNSRSSMAVEGPPESCFVSREPSQHPRRSSVSGILCGKIFPNSWFFSVGLYLRQFLAYILANPTSVFSTVSWSQPEQT